MAWVLLSACLLGVAVAALVGWGVGIQAMDRGRIEHASGARVEAVLLQACGLGVLIALAAVLGVLWARVRRVVEASNAAYWGREWRRVGPEWSRRWR